MVEGVQGSGKTHLINSLPDMGQINFKLSVAVKGKELGYGEGEFVAGMGVGRDLSILEMFPAMNKHIVMDRGILSTLVWNYMQDRISEDRLDSYVNLLNPLLNNPNVQIIWVYGIKEGYGRDRGDGYDGVPLELQTGAYYKFMLKFKGLANITSFCNMFDSVSDQRFERLIRRKFEHK
jgi:thymidylate kinase